MFSNLVSLFNNSISQTSYTPNIERQSSNNPFASADNNNPFVGQSYSKTGSWAKNQPVAGGYFAGYYNGVPNIVGRKLFIEA